MTTLELSPVVLLEHGNCYLVGYFDGASEVINTRGQKIAEDEPVWLTHTNKPMPHEFVLGRPCTGDESNIWRQWVQARRLIAYALPKHSAFQPGGVATFTVLDAAETCLSARRGALSKLPERLQGPARALQAKLQNTPSDRRAAVADRWLRSFASGSKLLATLPRIQLHETQKGGM